MIVSVSTGGQNPLSFHAESVQLKENFFNLIRTHYFKIQLITFDICFPLRSGCPFLTLLISKVYTEDFNHDNFAKIRKYKHPDRNSENYLHLQKKTIFYSKQSMRLTSSVSLIHRINAQNSRRHMYPSHKYSKNEVQNKVTNRRVLKKIKNFK